MSGVLLQDVERVGAALGDDDVGVAAFEQRGHREDVAEVVVDDEDLRAVDRAGFEQAAARRSGRGGRGARGFGAASVGRRRPARGRRRWPSAGGRGAPGATA